MSGLFFSLGFNANDIGTFLLITVLLICKLANEALLYVRLPAHSLWCCLGRRTEDRDPGAKQNKLDEASSDLRVYGCPPAGAGRHH